jgi:ATP-dependent helicase HepA
MVAVEQESDEVRCPICGAPLTERMATRGPNAGNVFLGCTRFPACRGSLSVSGTKPTPHRRSVRASRSTPRGQRQTLKVGDLIVSSANDLGVGKAVERHGDTLILEYFDNPGQAATERFRAQVPMKGLRRFKLDQEVRAFWQKDDVWHSGRLEEINQYRDISVRSRGQSLFLRERDVYIRWDRPLDDPVGFGEVGLMESPYLSDLRRPFMQHTLRQRSAAHGMGAALSSSIQLHPHQLDAARRVLEDPIQRYLLADEVGLGKTIEAGIVIRQILQDYPASTVSLILPPFLLEQWRRELETKFGIADFAPGRIKFARDDRQDDWASADLLIVDEAHNLARLRTSENPQIRARYERLTTVALKSTRLLLLSATPVLHNEDIFLGMLQLLDPSLYGRATVDDLREKIAVRTDLARSLLGLKPSLPASVITRRLNDLRGMLVADERVENLLDAVAAAATDSDKESLTRAIDELQAHVADVYRVHRRMIRTRRTEGLRSGYDVKGRSTPTLVPLNSDVLRVASALIDEWRQYALASAEVGELGVRTAAILLAEACSLLLDPQALAMWARRRRESASTQDEAAVLQRLEQTLEDTDRDAVVSCQVADKISYEVAAHERAVVFCPTSALAEEIGKSLGDLVGEDVVGLHLESSDPASLETMLRSFEASGTGNRIIVCDKSAEEGRNFQLADVVVHVGLPSDANKLEQRIGRSDRWTGATDCIAARSYLVTSDESTDQWDVTWYEIVHHGFEIFTKSIASLQHAVDLATLRSWQSLLLQGVDAAQGLAGEIREQLAAELNNVREQDALDSREARTDSHSIYAQIVATEAVEQDFGIVTDNLLARDGIAGNIRLKRIGAPTTGAGSYSVTPDSRAEPPLIPLWRVRRDFVRLEGQAGTFRRDVAVDRPDVRLYRYGAPFIDAVSDFVWNDDRGRCFGLWRHYPDWSQEEFVAYRFDYHVEANLPAPSPLAAVSDADESHTIQRRADSIFPPAVETVWIDMDGVAIIDPDVLSVLERPYRKPAGLGDGGDFNLNRTRLQQAHQVLPATYWRDAWRAAEAAAKRRVVALESFVARVESGSELCAQDALTRERQLTLRESYTDGDEASALRAEREVELAMAQTLMAAVRTPRLSLDSTGIVIMAGYGLGD